MPGSAATALLQAIVTDLRPSWTGAYASHGMASPNVDSSSPIALAIRHNLRPYLLYGAFGDRRTLGPNDV